MFKQTGTVRQIYPVEVVNANFTKRGMCIESEGGAYPMEFYFEATNTRVPLLEPLKPGDNVQVTFSISCKKYQANDGKVRWFNSLYVIKVEMVKITPMQNLLKEQEVVQPVVVQPEIAQPEVVKDDAPADDGLPF